MEYLGMKIKAYLSSDCPWSGGVCAVLEKYQLPFEKLDVSSDPKAFAEMTRRTGQMNTPCVDIDGVILTDISAQEVEDYLLSRELVGVPRGATRTLKANPSQVHVAGILMEEPEQFF